MHRKCVDDFFPCENMLAIEWRFFEIYRNELHQTVFKLFFTDILAKPVKIGGQANGG
jgi:hypothetical protein